jgi:hypothetical protein
VEQKKLKPTLIAMIAPIVSAPVRSPTARRTTAVTRRTR